ncbi:MAG: hypothetical protein ACRDP8_04645 [Actinopolymorphaceae bacterium]
MFDDMVEIALYGWSGTAGLATGAVHRLDESALRGGGFVASAGGLVVDDFPVEGDGAAVFESASGGVFDVVDHFRGDGPESGEFSCLVGEAEPRFQVGNQLDLRHQVFVTGLGTVAAITRIVQIDRRVSTSARIRAVGGAAGLVGSAGRSGGGGCGVGVGCWAAAAEEVEEQVGFDLCQRPYVTMILDSFGVGFDEHPRCRGPCLR